MFLMLSPETLRNPAHKRNSLIGKLGTASLVSVKEKIAKKNSIICISKHIRSVFFASLLCPRVKSNRIIFDGKDN